MELSATTTLLPTTPVVPGEDRNGIGGWRAGRRAWTAALLHVTSVVGGARCRSGQPKPDWPDRAVLAAVARLLPVPRRPPTPNAGPAAGLAPPPDHMQLDVREPARPQGNRPGHPRLVVRLRNHYS
ncbi:MAG TPA: hypothetical protein VLW50_04010 [Streptosporangiaceae bacterium]|nr:hypothetical protein [Streptosporangiaceae bacterium]